MNLKNRDGIRSEREGARHSTLEKGMQGKFQAEQEKKVEAADHTLKGGPFSWSDRGLESKNRNFDKNYIFFQLSGKRAENQSRSQIHVFKKCLPEVLSRLFKVLLRFLPTT